MGLWGVTDADESKAKNLTARKKKSLLIQKVG